LTFTVATDIPRQQSVVVQFPMIGGIKLPALGVRVNQTSLLVSVSAKDGNVVSQAITKSEPVGVFLNATIEYDPPLASAVVKLTISFTPQMRMVVGDKMDLVLPLFLQGGKNATATFLVSSSPEGKIRQATWNQARQVLSFRFAVDECQESFIFAQERFVVTVPSSAGLSLPSMGVRLNQQTLTLASNETELGPVFHSSLDRVEAVGSFFAQLDYGTPELHISEYDPSTITVSFRPQMHLYPTETIKVQLSTFLSAGDVLNSVVSCIPLDAIGLASWNSTSNMLVLTVNQTMVPNTALTIVVPGDFGIRKPVAGLRWNHSQYVNLSVSTEAQDGPVLPIPIPVTNAVGQVYGVEAGVDIPMLDFDPAYPGATTNLLFTFLPMMPVLSGDTMKIYLPGFVSNQDGVKPVETVTPLSASVTVSWVQATSTLTLTFSDIEAASQVRVLVPSSAGLQLPAIGIRSEQYFTFAFEIIEGPVPVIPMKSPTLGALAQPFELQYQSNLPSLAPSLKPLDIPNSSERMSALLQ